MRTRDEYRGLLEKYSFRNLSDDEAVTAGLSYQLAQVELLLDIRDMLTKIETRLWVANVKSGRDGLSEVRDTAKKLQEMMHTHDQFGAVERGSE